MVTKERMRVTILTFLLVKDLEDPLTSDMVPFEHTCSRIQIEANLMTMIYIVQVRARHTPSPGATLPPPKNKRTRRKKEQEPQKE